MKNYLVTMFFLILQGYQPGSANASINLLGSAVTKEKSEEAKEKVWEYYEGEAHFIDTKFDNVQIATEPVSSNIWFLVKLAYHGRGPEAVGLGPVQVLSWNEAAKFLAELNEILDEKGSLFSYRLPLEDEIELPAQNFKRKRCEWLHDAYSRGQRNLPRRKALCFDPEPINRIRHVFEVYPIHQHFYSRRYRHPVSNRLLQGNAMHARLVREQKDQQSRVTESKENILRTIEEGEKEYAIDGYLDFVYASGRESYNRKIEDGTYRRELRAIARGSAGKLPMLEHLNFVSRFNWEIFWYHFTVVKLDGRFLHIFANGSGYPAIIWDSGSSTVKQGYRDPTWEEMDTLRRPPRKW